jgi:Flp pilus assembly pilin Flp
MRDERGATLIELMIAMTLVLITLVGYIGTLNAAARSTGTAHRHTVTSYLRATQIDHVAVTARAIVRQLPPNQWVVAGCYDVDSQPILLNGTLAAAFACDLSKEAPRKTYYRSWVRVEPAGLPEAARSWTVRTFGERVPADCLDPKTNAPPGTTSDPVCVAGNFFITD